MGDRGGISLLVRNISRRLRPEDIRQEFERFGEVRDVYIPKDFYTKEPKGFAFVEFRSEREADEARRNLDGMRVDGRDIRVVFAQERRKSTEQMRERERMEKRGGGRRSRSRSLRRRGLRGRSRSRERRTSTWRSSRSRSPVKGRSRSRSRSRSGSPRRMPAARSPSVSLRRSASPRRSGSPAARSPSPSPRHSKGRSHSVSSRRGDSLYRRHRSPLRSPRRE